jgi:4-hydroxy-tetrahydrodipicolinate reductase
MRRIKIAQFGLGPIGKESLRLAAERADLEVIGAVEIDPALAGRPAAEALGCPLPTAARIHPTFAALTAHAGLPDVLLHTAGSDATRSFAQVMPALEAGVSVASTCEELIFPRLLAPERTGEIDALCRRTGARLVGTGVNPGFVMDVLPLCLTGVCREVSAVYVERVVDARTRRQPLQAKIGSGQDPAEFRARFAAGTAGHAGFRQSVALLAHGLGWRLDEIRETCEPVVAESRVVTAHFDVAPGRTLGLHQRCVGLAGGETRIRLDLQMYLGAPLPHDAIVIQGRPGLNVHLQGGVAGDDATVAALLNVIPSLLAAAPGVRLLTELPLTVCRNAGATAPLP